VLALESNFSLAVDGRGYVSSVFDGQFVGDFVLDPLSPGQVKDLFNRNQSRPV
jgi:hypothetical protein